MLRWGDKVTELHLVSIRLININKYQQVIGVWVREKAQLLVVFPSKAEKLKNVHSLRASIRLRLGVNLYKPVAKKKSLRSLKWSTESTVLPKAILSFSSFHAQHLALASRPFTSVPSNGGAQTSKFGACLPACLSPTTQTGQIDGTDRQRAEWWIKNLSQLLRKKPDTFPTQPNSLQGTTYLSLPVCTYLFTAVSLIRAVSLSLSLWQPDTVFVAILVFLCTAQCACVCHSCICWETHTSAHWSHSASPLIKTHAFSSITVTKTERNPHKKTLNITADILTQPLQFLRFCCHCWKRSVATSTSFLNGTCGLLGPWRNAYFAPFMNVLI